MRENTILTPSVSLCMATRGVSINQHNLPPLTLLILKILDPDLLMDYFPPLKPHGHTFMLYGLLEAKLVTLMILLLKE